MKKLIALVLALALVLMVGAAFAQTVGTASTGTGSITISNAAKGETYGVVKLFDATVNGSGAINYTGTIPQSLSSYFTQDSAGNIFKAENVDDDDLIAAVQTWAADQTPSASVESDGSVLTFQGLAYGYYAVKSTQGATITIDSTNPTATIYDKNSKDIDVSKSVNDINVKIGQQVTYTIEVDTVNFVGSGTSAKKVDKYIIEDTLPNFLSDVTVTGITVGGTAITTQQFDANKKIEIPWVDATTGDSLYANGAKLVITYTAVVTDSVNVTATGNTNTVTVKPHFTDNTDGEPHEDTETIYSYTFGLIKVNDGGTALADATFELPFYVKRVGTSNVYNYAGTSESAGAVNTVTTGSDGAIYIHGIATDETTNTAQVKNTTFSITETVAPAGYNKLTAAFTVTATPERSTTITRYWDENNKLTETVTQTTTTFTAAEPVSGFKTVINKAGTELPSTGGIGTTIFYIVGGLLVIGAAVILVARRKAHE